MSGSLGDWLLAFMETAGQYPLQTTAGKLPISRKQFFTGQSYVIRGIISMTLAWTFGSTILIRCLAAEDIGFAGLLLNAVISWLSASVLVSLWKEDIPKNRLLLCCGPVLLATEILLIVRMFGVYDGSQVRPAGLVMFVTMLSMVLARFIYFLLAVAGFKDIRTAELLRDAPDEEEPEGGSENTAS
jgi:hypothetical protein